MERDPGFLGAVPANRAICMRAEICSYSSVCACVHAETHDVAAERQSGVCPEKYVTPVTKIDKGIKKARAMHAHAK